ncbi:MAG: TIM-barrel domain-containing protein, partial [Bacillota bacterium]
MRNFKALLNLETHPPFIEIGKGRATYRMKRGTFKTKDKVIEKRTLPFKTQEGSVLYFTDGQVTCTLKVEEIDHTILSIECPPTYNRFWLHLKAQEDEHIYGCGEQFAAFDLKGKSVPIWVSERHSVKKLLKKALREKFLGVNPGKKEPFKDQATYYKQPSFLSSRKYMVHAETSHYAEFTFNEEWTTLYFREVPKRIHLFFAESFMDLASRFNRFLGIQQPLPEWTSKGVILAPQGGLKAVDAAIKTALENGIEVSGVWSQDWSGHLRTKFGYQVLWDWRADDATYPDLKEKIKRWNKQGIHFLGYINTFLKEGTPLFDEAAEKGYLVKNAKGKPYLIESTTFKAGIFDLTNPDAYDWVKALIKREMIGIGMSGWMADFGEYLPTDAHLHIGHAEEAHNRWPDLWARVNHEAIKESGENGFFFSRAAYSGTASKTHSLWIGDQHVDFSDAYGLGSV